MTLTLPGKPLAIQVNTKPQSNSGADCTSNDEAGYIQSRDTATRLGGADGVWAGTVGKGDDRHEVLMEWQVASTSRATVVITREYVQRLRSESDRT